MGLFDNLSSNVAPAGNEPLSSERLKKALQDVDIRFQIDEDGDIVAIWENLTAYFETRGNSDEILICRSIWDVRPPVEQFPSLCEWVNRWNVSHYWPRVGVIPRDEHAMVVTDLVIDLESGITDDFLRQQLNCFVGTTLETYESLEKDFPEHTEWFRVGVAPAEGEGAPEGESAPPA